MLPYRDVVRAKIVLLAVDVLNHDEIAAHLDIDARGQKRFSSNVRPAVMAASTVTSRPSRGAGSLAACGLTTKDQLLAASRSAPAGPAALQHARAPDFPRVPW